jgi:UDP-N-acetylmuramate--alanine ligase
MDCYRDMQDVEQTFVDFLDRLPFYGMAVVCNDDDRVRALIPRLARRAVTYGQRQDSDFRIHMLPQPNVSNDGVACAINHFTAEYRGQSLGEFRLFVPGMHNVLNATAAIAVGIGLDIKPDHIRRALEEFRGVDRRFQLKGKAAGVSVVDDYGHHPTEIRATLAAARQCGFKRIHVIFQPHRYTRTRDLMDEFASAFSDADTLVVLDIYAASEQPISGITGESLAERITKSGPSAGYASSFEHAVSQACANAQPGDMILTLGAGSVSQIGPMLLEALQAKSPEVIQA